MAAKPLVSIIIPTYNEQEVIGNCLRSIEKQGMKEKIEIIIVDDKSTDNTKKIVSSFKKRLNIRWVINGTKDAERGKKIGLEKARGDFFMYMDADMEFRDNNWFEVSTLPLLKDEKVIGTLASFGAKKEHNALTRCISYDIFQRDPIFIAFTPNIKSTMIKKEKGYILCKFKLDKIPAQSLCLYRRVILNKIFKKDYNLMDNDVPVILVKNGYDFFAFCPDVRVYHLLLKNLRELFRKRMRGVLKTYTSDLENRQYKWFNFQKKKNIFLMMLWVIYANTLIPALIYGIYKSIKHLDLACLYEPLITLVSTDALIYGTLKSKVNFRELIKKV